MKRRFFGWCVVLLVVAGCSSGDDDDDHPQAPTAATGGLPAGGGGGGNMPPAGGAGAGRGGNGTGASGAGGAANGGASGKGGASPSGSGGQGGAPGGSGDSGVPQGGSGDPTPPPSTDASVLQYHKNASRDGVYVDAAFTRAAAAGLKKAWSASISGPTYAQPLFIEGGSGGKDIVITATEQNEVTAVNAADGMMVWRKTFESPAPGGMGCGNINPLGITGTPVVDAASKRLFFDVMTNTGGYKHLIYALSLEDGSTVSGWPVDVGAKVKSGSTSFNAGPQNQRGALIILDGKVFVPYGGHAGDCGEYHGWVVGVPIDDPSKPIGWATRAKAGGIWAPGGISSDGTSLFVATGNTMDEGGMSLFSAPTMYGDGESIIRLPPSLQLSTMNADFASAMNWSSLDKSDTDIGGSGPVVFSVPGATPDKLVLGLGKDSNAYLADLANLGGMGKWVATKKVSSQQIIQAAVAYTTPTGTFFAFRAMGSGCPSGSGQITAVKVGAASPPTMNVAWCAGSGGNGSPMVTTTDGSADTIVWYVAGDNKLHGFNGETGEAIFNGGSDTVTINKFQTPIAAKGKIFVAAGNQLVAFAP